MDTKQVRRNIRLTGDLNDPMSVKVYDADTGYQFVFVGEIRHIISPDGVESFITVLEPADRPSGVQEFTHPVRIVQFGGE